MDVIESGQKHKCAGQNKELLDSVVCSSVLGEEPSGGKAQGRNKAKEGFLEQGTEE